jgi:DNA-binding LacI/PurR family transcriptional regulator
LNPDVVIGMLPFSAADLDSMRVSGVPRIVPDPNQPANWEGSGSVIVGPSLQVRHLAELGHRKLAFAGTEDPRLAILVQARLAAARQEASRLALPPLDLRAVDLRDGSAAEAVLAWRQNGVSGVVAYNDDIAAVVTGAAVRAGIAVPSDLAVIGHDDSPIAEMFVPSLSTIHTDDIGFGRQLAGIALHAADGRPAPEEDPAFTATVIRREST